jgi:hypothetical protein
MARLVDVMVAHPSHAGVQHFALSCLQVRTRKRRGEEKDVCVGVCVILCVCVCVGVSPLSLSVFIYIICRNRTVSHAVACADRVLSCCV